MIDLIIASGNKGKVREFSEILSDLPLHVTSLQDHWEVVPDIEETGVTFYDNARIKAEWVFGKCSGTWVLADDSGLEVDAIGGAPGVRSARFAGEKAGSRENIDKLLSLLQDIPMSHRTARFRCVLVLITSPGVLLSTEGTCEGRIILEPRGDMGFGYDPVFVPDNYDKTFSELSSGIKHSLSHRGKALLSMRENLHELLLQQ